IVAVHGYSSRNGRGRSPRCRRCPGRTAVSPGLALKSRVVAALKRSSYALPRQERRLAPGCLPRIPECGRPSCRPSHTVCYPWRMKTDRLPSPPRATVTPSPSLARRCLAAALLPRATTETDLDVEQMQRTLAQLLPPYKVLLHNDDYNSMD